MLVIFFFLEVLLLSDMVLGFCYVEVDSMFLLLDMMGKMFDDVVEWVMMWLGGG